MAKKPRINGLVLAGGVSSRMGADKRLINFHGVPQGEFLFRLLQPYCDEVFTSCNAHQQVHTGLNPLRDTLGASGPINGILSAFECRPARAWLVVAVDMPNINTQLLDILISKRNHSQFATCFYNPFEKIPEPLCAVWEPAGLSALGKRVKQGVRSPRVFLENNRKHVHLIVPENIESLLNVNVRSELERFKSTYRAGGISGAEAESPEDQYGASPIPYSLLFSSL